VTDIQPRRAGSTVRDYIPEDEVQTEQEIARKQMLKGMGIGHRADFVPAADHVLRPPSGSQQQAEEAVARAMAAQASAARNDFQNGVERLRGLNVANAIEAITQAPFAVQEMLLIAEKLNGNRTSILQRFGEPDPEAVRRWQELLAGAPEDTEASAGTVETKPNDAKE
jgi:hypothetical protein